ncbi:hypothetical protein I79_003701 [Cricetulus griseus]|uniref:Uncharacterized protein n=1 Tax=Cricetulus griseus TaxID=10029 RepID=G3H0N7_CRIGR|nr:hypothetical protein I79_003701 [Cricetulus griseus]
MTADPANRTESVVLGSVGEEMYLELFATADYLSIQFCGHILCLSLAILGSMVPYSGALLMMTPLKDSQTYEEGARGDDS